MTRAALKKHVSASQIATYRDCPRKWALQYVDGLRPPPNKAAQLGLDVHKVIERWLKFGTAPDLNTREGQIAFAGVKHLPAPSAELRVEHEMRFEFEQVEYLGYLDLHYSEQADGAVFEPGANGVAVATEIAAEREIIVTDQKTSTNIDKWGKTEGELLVDPQRILYSVWATLQYGARRVRARWVYYATRPPYRSRVVEIVQTREEIWAAMGPVHETAKEITRARQRPSSEAEQNFHACHAYGGCPFRERCHAGLSSTDRMLSIFAQMDRADRARDEPVSVPAPASAREGKVLPPGGAREKQETAAVVPQRQEEPMSLLQTLKNKEAGEASEPLVAAVAKPEEKRPGMDPAKTRAAYDAKEPLANAPAKPETTLVVVPPEVAGDPVPLPPEVEEQLAEAEGLEAIMQTGDAPEPKGKKGKSAKDNGVLKLAIADDRTGKLVLHAIGLLAGRTVADVEEHTKALYG